MMSDMNNGRKAAGRQKLFFSYPRVAELCEKAADLLAGQGKNEEALPCFPEAWNFSVNLYRYY